jgi:Zinc-binding dehydrogenase
VTALASAENLEFVRSLGADEVIDYNATDFTEVVRDQDAVLDVVGGDYPARRHALSPTPISFATSRTHWLKQAVSEAGGGAKRPANSPPVALFAGQSTLSGSCDCSSPIGKPGLVAPHQIQQFSLAAHVLSVCGSTTSAQARGRDAAVDR